MKLDFKSNYSRIQTNYICTQNRYNVNINREGKNCRQNPESNNTNQICEPSYISYQQNNKLKIKKLSNTCFTLKGTNTSFIRLRTEKEEESQLIIPPSKNGINIIFDCVWKLAQFNKALFTTLLTYQHNCLQEMKIASQYFLK